MGSLPSTSPAWPDERWISPTALRGYSRCPHRVRLRYLDRIPEPKTFSVQLSKGRITHDLLAMSARRIVRGEGDFPDDWLYRTA